MGELRIIPDSSARAASILSAEPSLQSCVCILLRAVTKNQKTSTPLPYGSSHCGPPRILLQDSKQNLENRLLTRVRI